MKVAIVGAGLTGLTAGYELAQTGHQVTIFEQADRVGGLARSFRQPGWKWEVEEYPHHLFTSDQTALQLIEQLQLASRLHFHPGRSAYLCHDQVHRFDSPATILTFKPLSWPQKVRVGLAGIKIKTGHNWSSLTNQTAWQWSEKTFGTLSAKILWQPLLEKKFGPHARSINAAWLWSRIKKRSFKLGYLEGGLQTLIDKLVKEIKSQGNEIWLNRPVKKLRFLTERYDRVLVTTPTSTFVKLARGLKLKSFFESDFSTSVGSLSFTLALKKPLLPQQIYWLNVTDPEIPFVFLDEHTNLIDSKFYAHQHLIYLGSYYPHSHPFFNQSPKEILAQFLPHLKKINPAFNHHWIVSTHLTRHKFSQPVHSAHKNPPLPPFETGCANLFLANLDQVFPWDRGVNYAIKSGQWAAQKIQTK